MDITEQLRVLQAAQGDPAQLALATVDLAFPALTDGERAELRTALEAAAIPHWCDAGILAALLEISSEAATAQLARLRKLTVIEPFPARGEDAVNVHETSRLALRRSLATDRPDWFRTWSQRVAEHFATDDTPAGRIEWIYHRLCSAPDEAAGELERLDRDWSGSARPEDRQALAASLRELLEMGSIYGRARVWASLCIAWSRVARDETAQLGNAASDILDLASNLGDLRAVADAQCLIGAVYEAQGKLIEARAAFGQYLAISRKLAEQDPSNADWQRELAMALSRIGDVLQSEGNLSEAYIVYQESLAIRRRLVDQEPSNAGWQRGLAVTSSRIGGILEAQGLLRAAKAAFEDSMAILRHLTEQDPTNADWQRNLAAVHSNLGDVLESQGNLREAEASFGESLAIFRRLALQDPSNSGWKRGLAAAYSRIGGLLESQGQLSEAQTAFGEFLSILRGLTEQDAGNAGWQRDLAVALAREGDILEAQGKLSNALAAFEESLAILAPLAEQDPNNAGWQRDLAVTFSKIGGVLAEQGHLSDAQAAFSADLAISRRLNRQDPSNADWQRDLATACWRSARIQDELGDRVLALPQYEEAARIFAELVERFPDFTAWHEEREAVERELQRCRITIRTSQ
jgi:tetratricopeptide (TPR) repeat protein